MYPVAVLKDYFVWHYSVAYADILRVWKNYLLFITHLFSIKTVLRTFFSPWKRIKEKPVNFFAHPNEFFANIVVDILMRFLGMLFRVALLGFALMVLSLVFVLGLTFFLAWSFLPLILAQMVITGIALLF